MNLLTTGKQQSLAAQRLDLSGQLIAAAGENKVDLIKQLVAAGADINALADVTLGGGTIVVRNGKISGTEAMPTNALMIALFCGAFEAALYLADTGADGTYERKGSEITSGTVGKAVDFLISDYVQEKIETNVDLASFDRDALDDEAHVRRCRNFETDLFSPAQRILIFNALLRNAPRPQLLLSESTAKNVVEWGRAELIPLLAKAGVVFGAEEFVAAAKPLFRPLQAVATLEALLPYVDSVNVTFKGGNAGHKACHGLQLEAFRWLHLHGLDKHAHNQDSNMPSYAHCLAASGRIGKTKLGDDRDHQAFLKFLFENGYPIDYRGGRLNETAVYVAMKFGSAIRIATELMNLGVPPPQDADMIRTAVRETRCNRHTAEEAIQLMRQIHNSGAVPYPVKALHDALQLILDNPRNVDSSLKIVRFLLNEGVKADKRALELWQNAVAVRGNLDNTLAKMLKSSNKNH